MRGVSRRWPVSAEVATQLNDYEASQEQSLTLELCTYSQGPSQRPGEKRTRSALAQRDSALRHAEPVVMLPGEKRTWIASLLTTWPRRP